MVAIDAAVIPMLGSTEDHIAMTSIFVYQSKLGVATDGIQYIRAQEEVNPLGKS
jgi:hypothetical protein